MKNRRCFVKNMLAGSVLPFMNPLSLLAQSNKKETKNFADQWQFIGPSIQEADYHVWGASPIIDELGKVHLFAARWRKRHKVDPGWRSHSEIAHYISNNPEGPFQFSDVVLKGTGKNTWDKYGAHNPNIHKVGDEYVLLYIGNSDYAQPPHPANQCIGMAIAKNLNGPWKKVNVDGKILNPPTNKNYWNYNARNGVNNPALLPYNGGFLLYFKSNGYMMGLAVAESLTGPYVQLPFPVTRNNKTIEDGYAFLYKDKICMLTTDNHGILKKGGGILWKSDDGVNFSELEPGFKLINEYLPPGEIKNPVWHYGSKDLMKFERPQLLMINEKPAFLYLAGGCNIYGGDTTVNYVMKFLG
ncbi:glycoside hydrolase family protein [Pedobacter endophyticus]|uniref:Glycoside hydrolase family protein n=1 Tax=Pedobacter endophyticus TaxID=2789740 RepID=A0A7S9KZI2_9SPHI|nr:glycoside hydrolase family protein [Pedobacter endophyticus]QPH39700.1 glycoside hydrolase family protein [Pedobacter endophyticus]